MAEAAVATVALQLRRGSAIPVLACGIPIRQPIPPMEQAVTANQNALPGEQLPYFLASGEGERYSLGPMLATIIGNGRDTGSLMEGVVLIGAKGSLVPLHRHSSSHEAIYVLEDRRVVPAPTFNKESTA